MKKSFSKLLLVLSLLLPASSLHASPGDLDTTFGSGGFSSLIDFNQSVVYGMPYAITLQPSDGKIVVGGYAMDGSAYAHFAVARLNTDGSLDENFGTGGKTDLFNFGGNQAILKDLALQPSDEKIIVIGSDGSGPTFQVGVARLTVDGVLDTSFGGGDGKADLVGPSGGEDFGEAVEIQSDGKIIVGGYSSTSSQSYVFRMNSDGQLDSGFGSGGVSGFLADPGTGILKIEDIALQSDGKVVIAGYDSSGTSNAHISLARLNSDGNLDTTFGLNGYATLPTLSATGEYATGLQIGNQDEIFVGGVTNKAGQDSALVVKLTSSGDLDTSYGTNGFTTWNPGTGYTDELSSLVLQADGKIVASLVHYHSGTSVSQFSAFRLNDDGSLDETFGTAGKVNLNYPDLTTAISWTIGVDSSGNIVLAGAGIEGSQSHFALARLSGNSADLEISASATPSTAQFGDSVTLTFTITNNGPDASGAITLTDTLPSGLTFTSITPSAGSCTGTTTLTCSLGALENAETATVTLIVSVANASQTSNIVTLSANGSSDSDSTNNTTTQNLTSTTSSSGGCNLNSSANSKIGLLFFPLAGLVLIETYRRLKKASLLRHS